MPAAALGSERSSAIYRLVGVVYLVTIHPFVLIIGVVGGIVALVLDLVWGLLFDDGADGTLSDWGERLFYWPLNQLTWVIVGDPDSFQWLP